MLKPSEYLHLAKTEGANGIASKTKIQKPPSFNYCTTYLSLYSTNIANANTILSISQNSISSFVQLLVHHRIGCRYHLVGIVASYPIVRQGTTIYLSMANTQLFALDHTLISKEKKYTCGVFYTTSLISI